MSSSSELLLSLLSPHMEFSSPLVRNATLEECRAVAEDDESFRRDYLASGDWFIGTAVTEGCHTALAYGRLGEVLLAALGAEMEEDEEEESVGGGLLRNMCHLLVAYAESCHGRGNGVGKLLSRCVRGLSHVATKNKKKNVLVRMLTEIVSIGDEDDSSLAQWYYAPALSLIAGLDTSASSSSELLNMFILRTISNNDKYPSAGCISLLRDYLCHLPPNTFNDALSPPLLLKMKAHPERCLSTFDTLLRTAAQQTRYNEWSLSEEETQKWISVCQRQMKSSKGHMREVGGSLLLHVARLTSQEGEMAVKLVEKGWDVQFNQPQQREAVYVVTEAVGAQLQKGGTAVSTDTISAVVEGLLAGLNKESDEMAEDKGQLALLRWLAILPPSSTPPTAAALYLTAKLSVESCKTSSSRKVSDFRTRIGGLLCGDILTEAQIQSILCAAYQSSARHGKTMEGGLVAVIEQAVKKHKTGGSVPPIDGVLALTVVLLLLEKGVISSPPSVVSNVFGGKGGASSSSFLTSTAVMGGLDSRDKFISKCVPWCIALYTHHLSTQKESLSTLFHYTERSDSTDGAGILRTLARSIITSRHTLPHLPQITPHITAVSDLLTALTDETEQFARDQSVTREGWNASRQNREVFDPVQETPAVVAPLNTAQLHLAVTTVLQGGLSGKEMVVGLMLMHVGTTMRKGGRQRDALVRRVLELWAVGSHAELETEEIWREMIQGFGNSDVMKQAGDSLILTLGNIAGFHDADAEGDEEGMHDDEEEKEEADPNDQGYKLAWTITTKILPSVLSTCLTSCIKTITSYSSSDMDLYRHSRERPLGATDSSDPSSSSGTTGSTAKSRKAGGGKSKRGKAAFGGDDFDDEEWERQMKKEKAAKKDTDATTTITLTAEEKKLLKEQNDTKDCMNACLEGFMNILTKIRCLFQSDVIVGNEALVCITPSLLYATAAGGCLSSPAFTSLPTLLSTANATLSAGCDTVYELDDEVLENLPAILRSVYRDTTVNEEAKVGDVAAVPHPCPGAIPRAVYALSDACAGGSTLSRPSFEMILPLLRAVLKGPRSPFQRSELVLDVIEAHTELLSSVVRREVGECLLEFLSQDRSVSTKATEVLQEVYGIAEEVTGPELAPLLGSMGALAGKRGRVGSLTVLSDLLSMESGGLKKNPLVENRIWINCHAEEEEIRTVAIAAWKMLKDQMGDDLAAPSKLYAASLYPLLNNDDKSIAKAAAKAYAHGMTLCPDTFDSNLKRLISSYIDNFPTEPQSQSSSSSVLPQSTLPSGKKISIPAPPPPKKQPKAIASLKAAHQKTKKAQSSGLAAAALGTGIGKPRSGTKKKSSAASALLKPKKAERTFDKNVLEAQFLTAPPSVKKSGPAVSDVAAVITPPAPAEEDTATKQSTRKGILAALNNLTSFENDDSPSHVTPEQFKTLLQFLVAYSLADPTDDVRACAGEAARDLIASFGDDPNCLSFLLPYLESALEGSKVPVIDDTSINSQKVPRKIMAVDHRKEGVVIALGATALHLLSGAEEYRSKIDDIVKMLQVSLKTPSEDVQSSAATCLVKLVLKMKKMPEKKELIEDILSATLRDCLHGESLALRRGGAYGLSAAVKGLGISSLKKHNVLSEIDNALRGDTPSQKEGGLFAVELLSLQLKLLFEPYVITLLPSLLSTFGDTSDHVRSAAERTTEVLMSQLSAHGVKLILPAVLKTFNTDPNAPTGDTVNWRTKVAGIAMLGSMSHCAPKQLSACLPQLVPQLTTSFSDTHPRVKAAAKAALETLCQVVRNPEIRSISPTLLSALVDPGDRTAPALETLIATEFLHAVDAPSLALVCPVLRRGLRDRSAGTKRHAALITGNMCAMIASPADFLPYLNDLISDLRIVLLDPIPDVRTTAAKAVGSLTRGLGEDKFPELRAWLLETATGNRGSVERAGAAQGLSEMLVACGQGVVEEVVIQELLPLGDDAVSSHREGVLWCLSYLPSGLGQGYASLITPSLPTLLKGLADDDEQVRDVALRAGRVLIKCHGKHHVDKILPTLENGMEHSPNVRIRLSSLLLLGDLLALIGNTKVSATDATDTQEEIRNAERAQSQIALALGVATRCRVLAGLYLARSDTAAVVRQNALMVWKSVVSVTARTLKEIMPVLVDKIVKGLGSGDPDRTEVAGRCLGDTVAKLGDDNTLPEIVPVLAKELRKADPDVKRGVCVGLTEVLESCSKESVIKHSAILVNLVRDALCDDSPEVRRVAPACFQSLYAKMGYRALEDTVPRLLVRMDSRSLAGLAGILSVRSRELLPYLIPKLLARPVTVQYANAIGGIAQVTSTTIHHHFGSIINVLLSELAEMKMNSGDEEKESEYEQMMNQEREEAIRKCLRSVSQHVAEEGVHSLVSETASKLVSDKAEMRLEGCWMFGVIVEERASKADFYPQIPIMYRDLLYRLNDDNVAVLKEANKTLALLAKHVPAEELVEHATFCKNLLASIVSDARRRKGGVGDGQFYLPGLNMPKGLEPLLPMHVQGILYGTPPVRENSARALGELLNITAPKYLPPALMIKITGPLLRIVGDRNPSHVKIAIVQTLGAILTKGGMALRAFVPQFQTTFVKSLSDPSRTVRMEAIKALGQLMPLSTRLDPLIKELVNQSSTASVVAVQTASLEALAVILKQGGKKAKLPDTIPSAMEVGKTMLWHQDEGVREAAAKVIGSAFELFKDIEEKEAVLSDTVLDPDTEECDGSEETERHGRACACFSILFSSSKKELEDVVTASKLQKMSGLMVEYMKDESIIVRRAACIAIGAILGLVGPSHIAKVESAIGDVIDDTKEDIEVHRGLAKGFCVAVTIDADIFRGKAGLPIMDGALKLAMSGVQRVQLAFNDFLWLALRLGGVDPEEDEPPLLQEYIDIASFESEKAMKSLVTKVLVRIKSIDLDAL